MSDIYNLIPTTKKWPPKDSKMIATRDYCPSLDLIINYNEEVIGEPKPTLVVVPISEDGDTITTEFNIEEFSDPEVRSIKHKDLDYEGFENIIQDTVKKYFDALDNFHKPHNVYKKLV